jgi:hypothetical protein
MLLHGIPQVVRKAAILKARGKIPVCEMPVSESLELDIARMHAIKAM